MRRADFRCAPHFRVGTLMLLDCDNGRRSRQQSLFHRFLTQCWMGTRARL